MLKSMNFSKWVFLIAGVYGILLVGPMYFMEERMGVESPPPVTHPELYYGFVGLTLAWQIAFLIISTNPERFRLFMIPSVLEKFSYAVALIFLFAQERIDPFLMWFAGIDGILGILFLIAFFKTPRQQNAS